MGITQYPNGGFPPPGTYPYAPPVCACAVLMALLHRAWSDRDACQEEQEQHGQGIAAAHALDVF